MIKNKKINNDDISVIILAGGFGSRIKHLYPNKPKPLIKIENKPFLYWLVREINSLNLKNIFYATGYMSEEIESWVKNNEFKNINENIIKEKKKLGTAGSIFNLINLCEKNLVVLNGDSFLANGIKSLINSISPNGSSALVCHHTKDISKFGAVSFNKENQLTGFNEKQLIGSGYINSGIYYFSKDIILKYKNKGFVSLEFELIPKMIENKEKIKVIKVNKPIFIDIGTEKSIIESSRIARKIFI